DSVSLRVEPPAPVLKTTAVKPDPGEDIAYTTSVVIPAGGGMSNGMFTAKLPTGTTLVEDSVTVAGHKAVPFMKDGGFSVAVGSGTRNVEVSFRAAVPEVLTGTTLTLEPSLDYTVEGIGKLHVKGDAFEVGMGQADLAIDGDGNGADGYDIKVSNNGPDPARNIKVKATDADGKEVTVPEMPDKSLPSGESSTLKIPTTSPKLRVAVESTTLDPEKANNTKELTRKEPGDPEESREADLSVKLTANTDKPTSGEALTYKIEVANKGAVQADGIRVKAVVPKDFKAQAPDGAIKNELPDGKGTELSWAVGNLASGKSESTELKGTVPSGIEELRSSVSVTTQTLESKTDDNKTELALKVDKKSDDTKDEGPLALTGAGGVAILGVSGASALAAGAWGLSALRRRNSIPGNE
ncbi:hypothetical protein ACFCXT_40025, partial [Streptomyces vinaceus]|uniref:hypothetical protein n=1 Tax=Streptomyces vinaceus TaxID=1960 RepID=UPI0035DA40C4